MNNFLSWQEKAYIEKTVRYSFLLSISQSNLSGPTRITVNANLGGSEISLSNYAPISFQAITLFYALDTLHIRLEEKNGKPFNPNMDFKKRLNALPMDNCTQVIFKFCYVIMREIRNKFMHDYPDSNTQVLATKEFSISEKVIYELFGLVIKYIELFNGDEFNRYDTEILKQITKSIFDQVFPNIYDNGFKNNLKNIFDRLEFNDVSYSWYRIRYIVKLKKPADITHIQRQSNFPIPNACDNLFLNSRDTDEYLIVIGDEKYLMFGSYLDECLLKNDLSGWKLTGNWIGREEYVNNYESS